MRRICIQSHKLINKIGLVFIEIARRRMRRIWETRDEFVSFSIQSRIGSEKLIEYFHIA